LVANPGLDFGQIPDFCGLHGSEIQGIADGEGPVGILGRDPIANNQVTREEIERCEKDPEARLVMLKIDLPTPVQRTKGARYTPVSKRQDRPAAIAWLLRHHPELADAQVGRLVGTTKPTIQKIRDRTHFDMANIKPTNPVVLGLCSQDALDEALARAARTAERARKEQERAARRAAKAAAAPAEAAADSDAEQDA
ncbi:MAG: DUF1013 domain-containing protein, partial [Alphaproteobacteria bacterium]|nr:DUF1013 domain-containing protein [Alphaproteobacteria bacterium]